MRSFVLLATLGLFTPTGALAAPLDFDHYHSQAEINNFMAEAAKLHPSIARKVQLGVSAKGREISYLFLSADLQTIRPAIYLNGTHHGDEWSSTESVLAFADYLINHQGDSEVAALLRAYSFYIQPLVNPDGHEASSRTDSSGRDPNRDYAFPGRSEEKSFRTPEIRLVKNLLDEIRPVAAAAYHSGIEEVLWPWCYTGSAPTNAAQISLIAKNVAKAMGFDRYLQSYDDYPTDGEFIDYTYMKFGTLSLTFEVSAEKTPDESELNAVVKRSIVGTLAFVGNVTATKLELVSLNPKTGESTQALGQFGRLGKRKGPRLE